MDQFNLPKERCLKLANLEGDQTVAAGETGTSNPSDATAGSASSIVEKRGDVWMMSNKPCQSCAREIAEIAMRSAGLDATDFRLRDTVIIAISDKVGAMLDAARNSQNETSPSVGANEKAKS